MITSKGFPTIRLFKKDNKKVFIDYKNEYTIDDFADFI